MDHIVGMLVRFMVFLARFAHCIPGMGFSRWEPGEPLRILLLGYNGKRNTGADARVECIVEQIGSLFGAENVEISVMTIDPAATRSYFGARVRQVPVDTIFFLPTLRECSRNHMAILVEGSTLKSTFANALTLYFCQAAGVMKAQGKPCVAYGSEAGEMDAFVRRVARILCSDVRFVARTQSSLEVIDDLGLKGILGADTAWPFDGSRHAGEVRDSLRQQGWDGRAPLLGVAPVNPFHWPVRPSLAKLIRAWATGDGSQRYEKWYFHAWSDERAQKFARYLDALADSVAGHSLKIGGVPVVIGMEAVDYPACEQLRKRLEARLGTPIPQFISTSVDAGPMAALLTSLHALVTSRYHAQVLAMRTPVVTVAVSMDERLANISHEMGLSEHLLLDVDDPHLADKLAGALEYVEGNASAVRDLMRDYRIRSLAAFDDMGRYLLDVAYEAFPRMGSVGEVRMAEVEVAYAG